VGFRVVDALAARHGVLLETRTAEACFGVALIDGERIGLLEPLTYMNESGEAVRPLLEGQPDFDLARLVVVYDDLDLPFGRLRIRARGSAGGQRGMQSVIEAVGGDRIGRLRFGVGRPDSEAGVVDHVLAGFSPLEEAALPESIGLACDALESIFREGYATAMDRYNAAPPKEAGPQGTG
jgi:PTH1 family peptidyl-tRNA hydrolase